jgi:hypothetical protein
MLIEKSIGGVFLNEVFEVGLRSSLIGTIVIFICYDWALVSIENL